MFVTGVGSSQHTTVCCVGRGTNQEGSAVFGRKAVLQFGCVSGRQQENNRRETGS